MKRRRTTSSIPDSDIAARPKGSTRAGPTQNGRYANNESASREVPIAKSTQKQVARAVATPSPRTTSARSRGRLNIYAAGRP